ncbi:hypothetical protein [Micromonospora sp. WMMD998]|uniref:hypothetical protein n=1 Tax=Micromonospora sp. WMMD998 TaxID=3016092 RepID=UPI00249B4811|nr:hypothetical protein [Micromonospora sp. WMMD998]WFE38041.1 hypothetical protein O7619_06185 [Micromonospora sp. WMMD998]
MTVSFPERNRPMQLNNFGSGPFVAGDNYGNIGMVDDQTRVALAEISRDLPPVGALIRKALDEGLIPPETVRSLVGVAQHINADVAHAIWEGGRNINEDTASWIWEGGRNINEDTASWIWEGGRNINEDTASWLLQAGRSINPEVASSLAGTADELKRAADRFERALDQMTVASGALRASKAYASEWSQTAEAMQSAADALAMATQVEAGMRDRFSGTWFKNGIIAGFAAAVALAIIVIVIQVNIT